MRTIFLLLLTLFSSFCWMSAHAVMNVVAAENFYGEVTKQLGGPYVNVLSILNNPNQDPHLFSINPSTAKQISDAQIIIYNGADYDPWVNTLIAAENQNKHDIIIVADLMGIKSGENPHIWYLPETIPIFAKKMVTVLSLNDPAHKNYFEDQLKKFNHDYQIIFDTVKRLGSRFKEVPVIATEPVFNDMSDNIGLKMHAKDFQINIMNDVPPSISQVRQFEDDLRQNKVRVLIFNKQVINPMTRRMLSLAEQANIPVLGVSETLPQGMTYIQWMLSQLLDLEKALQKNTGHSHAR